MLEDALQLASDVLFRFTGRQWPGICTETFRPYVCHCDLVVCSCPAAAQIELPLRPVRDVTEVKVDGEVVPPEYYRVDDHRWLVYLREVEPRRSRAGWPTAQDFDRTDDEVNTMSVTYRHGLEPPQGANRITAMLACELAKAFDPADTTCKLPKRVQTISRQGVSMAVLDPLDLFEEGRTGLTTVDLWIGSLNVDRKRRRAVVHKPGQTIAGRRRFRETDT